MPEKVKTPSIRFKGFNDDWEQRKFRNVAETRRGLTYKPTDIRDDGIRVLRSSNINEDKFVIGLDDVFVEENAINIPYVKTGDILITSANGSSRLVGKHAIIRGIQENSTVHGGFMLAASAKFPEFLNASMSSPWYSKFINIFVAGGNGSIGNLNRTDLDEQLIYIPEEIEQQQIGTFFSHIDNLTTLQQCKLEKFQNIKKAMLEKMFPKNGENVPEIRFTGFSDSWEQHKLGDILTEKKNSIVLEDNKIYELVTVRRRNEGVVSRGFLKGKDILVKNYFEIQAGDFIISKRQVIHGANGIVPQKLDKAIVSNEYLVANGNENITAEFWTLISKLPSMYRLFFLSSYGVDIEKLVFDVEDWKKRTFFIPDLSEQQAITEFFKNLDNLISLHQRKLEKLKNIKKACLEKLFV